MKPDSTKLVAAIASVGLLCIAATVDAAFVEPDSTPSGAAAFANWTRGDAGSTYQEWRGTANGGSPSLAGGGENFTTLYGLNQPDDNYINPNGIATAQYLDGTRNSTGRTYGFLISGSQNIYSFFASADWELFVPDYNLGSGATTTVILQLDVSGNEILVGDSTFGHPTAPNTVKIDGYDWVDHVELARAPNSVGGFDLYDVTHWFRFELPANIDTHLIEFDSYDPSLGEFDPEGINFGHVSMIGISVDTIVGASSIPGDLDHDGFVGLDDLDIVLSNWNQNVPPADAEADPSGDGFVGLDDLDIVLANWNAGTPPAQALVPEPSAVLIFGLACGAAGMSRRR